MLCCDQEDDQEDDQAGPAATLLLRVQGGDPVLFLNKKSLITQIQTVTFKSIWPLYIMQKNATSFIKTRT